MAPGDDLPVEDQGLFVNAGACQSGAANCPVRRLDAAARDCHASPVEVGVLLRLRDAATIGDLGVVHAPALGATRGAAGAERSHPGSDTSL